MRTTDRTTHIVGDTAIVRHTVTGDTERDGKTNPGHDRRADGLAPAERRLEALASRP